MKDTEELLALDVGEARTGVARMNTGVGIPEPLPELPGMPSPETIASLIDDNSVQRLIIGLPKSLNNNQETEQSIKTRAFVDSLKLTVNIPIGLVDEGLSTISADKWRARYPGASEDSLAACVILERYFAGEKHEN